MPTRIIVDSTADLAPEVKSRVHIVPMTVHFGSEEYIDGVTIDHKLFYEKLIESDVMPSTSQATPAAFAREYEKSKGGQGERGRHHTGLHAVGHLSKCGDRGGGI